MSVLNVFNNTRIEGRQSDIQAPNVPMVSFF